jgi:hypothetical protein
MTGIQPIDAEPDDGVAEMVTIYQRLAAMDPPALRSLAVELQRLSNESSAAAALQATPPQHSKARRDAQRAAAARVALAAVEAEC